MRGMCISTLACLVFIAAGCGDEPKPPIEKTHAAAKKEALSTLSSASPPKVKDVKLYGFEKDAQYWEVPDWSLEKKDYVGKTAEVSKDYSSEGVSSLKVTAAFPGKVWAAALVELEEYLDWTPYGRVSCDVYLPLEAPEGLKAKIILTVGNDWRFTEMSRAAFLIPGKWVNLNAGLKPGSDDWKMTVVGDEFRADVRKVAVRIESNKGPVYAGPIYIDNVRVE